MVEAPATVGFRAQHVGAKAGDLGNEYASLGSGAVFSFVFSRTFFHPAAWNAVEQGHEESLPTICLGLAISELSKSVQ